MKPCHLVPPSLVIQEPASLITILEMGRLNGVNMTYQLKPGQLLLFEKNGFDPIGSFITSQERETNICHAAFVGINGKIWTTGAYGFLEKIFYGQVDPEEYLKNRKYHVAEFDNLTGEELCIMDKTAKLMEGQPYGFSKVSWLMFLSNLPTGGVVKQIHFWPWKTGIYLDSPFCSESVANACWKAGRFICQDVGKKEPSAIAPSSIYTYAKTKETDLNIVYRSG